MAQKVKKRRLTKNEKRRLRKKSKKNTLKSVAATITDAEKVDAKDSKELAVQVEYVSADLPDMLKAIQQGEEGSSANDQLRDFSNIFEKFAKPEALCSDRHNSQKDSIEDIDRTDSNKQEGDDDDDEADNAKNPKKLSKRKRKLASRLSVAELKQLVKHPDCIEVHDVTSADPRLLVHLKSYRNTVPVPRHWCLKRKYLQGKRGIEKPPFQLPECIAMTGIDKIRSSLQEVEDKKGLKARARGNQKPKMGRMEIDYQVLYNAFFKYQKKPKNLAIHGDIYYENKEFEMVVKDKKPGKLSDSLKMALGMTDAVPPPWLINMQRYGPPPSYPQLKIPGLNAPIPSGASFGYHPGGWGKPPVNEFGRPLYGDVFGVEGNNANEQYDNVRVAKEQMWGNIPSSDEDDEEDEEEEDEEEMDVQNEGEGMETPMDTGISSVSEFDTSDTIDLRKGTSSVSSLGTETPTRQLYQVLETQQNGVGKSLYGSSHTYAMDQSDSKKSSTKQLGQVEITIDPSELDNLDDDVLLQKYEEAKQKGASKSDLAILQAARRKRSKRAGESELKGFKF